MSISENVLHAMQIIAEGETNKVSYDKTVVCEIIEDIDRKSGKYLVEEKGTRFYAYCESTKYRKGQQVYVLIPGGNYDIGQKTIISKYAPEEANKPIVYVPPSEQLVIMDNNNLVPSLFEKGEEVKEVGLKVNINNLEYSRKLIVDINTPTDFNSRFCTTLYLKCEFKCLLQNYNIESGEYGLEVELLGKMKGKVITKTLIFSSKDIFGNPFGFSSYVNQEAKLNINNIGFQIEHIKIYFYEDNNFKAYGFPPFKAEDFSGYTIFIRNIRLYYANDVSLIKNHTFKIYCNDLSYSIKGENNRRFIYSKWYNTDEYDRYIGYEKDKTYTMKWQHFVNGEWQSYNETDFHEETKNILLSKNQKKEQVKVILKEGYNEYESNILTFENADIIEEPLGVDQIDALSIELGKNSKNSYPLYDIDNIIGDFYQAYLERELSISVNCKILKISEEDFLNEASFSWEIPVKDTMLNYDESFLKKKGFNKKIINTNEFDSNTIQFDFDPSKKDKNNKGYNFYYQIKPVYSRNFINNDIVCTAFHNGIKYKATIHFDFSSSGANNSSYYLAIIPESIAFTRDKIKFFSQDKQEKSSLKLQALLFDADQRQVDLSTAKVTWTRPDGTEFIPKENKDILEVKNYYENLSNIYKVKVEVIQNKNNRDSQNENLPVFTTISCEYGLPFSKENNYCGITPIQIIYDSTGTNSKYYKDRLILFDVNTEEEIPVEWDIKYYTKKNSEDEKKYLPYLNKNKNKLLAQSLYVRELETKISLIAKKDKELLWEQPILISQNVHSSKVLNEWDGSLQINDKENYALSAMFGAGRKHPLKNTFDGILMGDLKASQGDSMSVGLFGYRDGAQSFGFNIDGTAFLGKAGSGQIKFDGTSSTIQSGNYKKDESGTKIELEEGHIDAFNFKLSAGNLILNSSPRRGDNNDYYFRVGENDNMISLSADNKLDIHSNKFTLEAKGEGNDYLGLFSVDQKEKIQINNSKERNDWRIIAGNAFGVTKDGIMFASNVSLTGKIEADNGRIGNWLIKDGYLEGINEDSYTYLAPPGMKEDYIFSTGAGKDQSKHPFYIKADGSLYAHNNVDIKGKITATSGKIGNWTIKENYLVGQKYISEKLSYYTYIATPDTFSQSYVFSAGENADCSQHNFWIKADGSFKASEGTLGGWTVKDQILSSENQAIYMYKQQDGEMIPCAMWQDINRWNYYAWPSDDISLDPNLDYNLLYFTDPGLWEPYTFVFKFSDMESEQYYDLYASVKMPGKYWYKKDDGTFKEISTDTLIYYRVLDSNDETTWMWSTESQTLGKVIFPLKQKTIIAPPGTSGEMYSHIFAAGSTMPKLSPFQILSDGSIIATRGRIGGWALSNSALYAEAKGGSMYLAAPKDDITEPVINIASREIDSEGKSTSYFTVDGKGNMSAKNAIIEGEVAASKFTMSDESGTYNFSPQLIYVPSTQQDLVTGITTKYYESGARIGSTEPRIVPIKIGDKNTGYHIEIPILTVCADTGKIPMAIAVDDISTLTTQGIRVIGY